LIGSAKRVRKKERFDGCKKSLSAASAIFLFTAVYRVPKFFLKNLRAQGFFKQRPLAL
jgi:hypothetical protein